MIDQPNQTNSSFERSVDSVGRQSNEPAAQQPKEEDKENESPVGTAIPWYQRFFAYAKPVAFNRRPSQNSTNM